MKTIAVLLLVIGGLLVAGGLFLLLMDKIPWLGQLPGDIHYRGKNFSFHFPLMTCIIISILLTIIINIIMRFFGK
ncbi:MAG: DUF2905 domain-containing protein [Desulfobulbales bacterium]